MQLFVYPSSSSQRWVSPNIMQETSGKKDFLQYLGFCTETYTSITCISLPFHGTSPLYPHHPPLELSLDPIQLPAGSAQQGRLGAKQPVSSTIMGLNDVKWILTCFNHQKNMDVWYCITMIITNHQSLCVPFNEFQDQDISGSFRIIQPI